MRNQAALDGVLRALQKPSVDIDDYILLKNAGFSLDALKTAGFDAVQLRAAGFSVRALRQGGFHSRNLSCLVVLLHPCTPQASLPKI